jgi:hypothetical protein
MSCWRRYRLSECGVKPRARSFGGDLPSLEAKYGGLDINEARRLRELEQENRRLKAAVAELTLDKQALKEVLSRKW